MSEPRRAVLYARYSTDLQTDKSIADQFSLCRAYAKREGYSVVGEYHDAAKSGASIMGRDGLQDLLAAAYSGQCDAVIVEHQDRLSRDQEDTAHVYKRLKHHRVDLLEVHGGKANTLTVGMKAIVAEMYREDNIQKVQRGMKGLIEAGKTAGGRAYGYTPDPANPGRPVIVPAEARIVVRIFEAYSEGQSPQAICRALNAEGVLPPRGKLWAPSALIGYEARGTGMLRNPIYKGVIVWGKVTMLKDPDTGKRISRPNPSDKRQTAEAPELRIVTDELFEAVQAQLAARSTGKRSGIVNQKRPKRLLSHLLKCGSCGSGMSTKGKDRSGRVRLCCSAHTNSGACPNPKTFYLDEVEKLFLDSLFEHLDTPDLLYSYAKNYLEERRRLNASRVNRRAEIEAQRDAAAKDVTRLTEWALNGIGDHTELLARAKAKGEERDRLTLELATMGEPESNIDIHPAAIRHYAEEIVSVQREMQRRGYAYDGDGPVSAALRELIGSITVYRGRDGDDALSIKVTGWLDAVMRAPNACGVKLVAEEGLEPPTRGL